MLTKNNLRDYQHYGIDYIKERKGSGLFLDMGAGKTATSLTVSRDLLDDFEVTKILIIAPLRVANTVWHNEALDWSHLKDSEFSIITGNLKNRQEAIEKDVEIYIVNRENIPWLVEYHKSKWPYDMLIIDESSSFKNPTSKRFRALKKILKYITKRVILTGTPAPNSYMDLWSQIYILDEGERLGKNITMFRNTYFDKDFMGYNYTLKQGSKERIDEKIKDIVFSMDEDDLKLDLPDLVKIVIDIPLPIKLQKTYEQFEDDMIFKIDEDNELSATNSAVLSGKLLQFCSGVVYDEEGKEQYFHDLKFDTLDEIIEENPDENLLVAYNFKHEKDRFLKRYKDARLLDGKNDDKTVKEWNEGKIKKLLVHPASAGHGLNLQKGGSMAIWLGFNWSLELYQQFNKRLHRPGQNHIVRIIHLAVGDIEYRLMRSLKKKDLSQGSLLEALKASL